MRKIETPLSEDILSSLRSGDRVLLSGYIYTARDAAHRRFVDAIRKGEGLPFDPNGQVIYYVGPTPPRPGLVVGAAGPTSSYRMDPYTLDLLPLGLKGMIGKGPRGMDVKKALVKYKAIYMAATGGAGALLSKCIKKSELIAYEDLGPEAVYRFYVEDMPLTVINDIFGGDLYEEGRRKWQR